MPSCMASTTPSWSDLPLDLLISIKDRLHVRSDLLSFRLVCSDWRSALPCPKPLPLCLVMRATILCGHVSFLKPKQTIISIPLPFPSCKTTFLCASNGWLLFTADNYSHHLFDPVSRQSHWLPPITSDKMMHKNWSHGYFGSTIRLDKAVVSVSRKAGVNVAGIAAVYDKMGDYIGEIFSFFGIGKEKKWHFSRKKCQHRMVGIVGSGGGDGKRFYAADVKCGVYVVEAGPPMRWRRFDLSLPKRILDGYDWETAESGRKRPAVHCIGMKETGEGYLKVYGSIRTWRWSHLCLFVKVKASRLRVDGGFGIAYGDGIWMEEIPGEEDVFGFTFEPRL